MSYESLQVEYSLCLQFEDDISREAKLLVKDKSGAYKWWFFSASKKKDALGVYFFISIIPLKTFCVQTLDKVIFISFRFVSFCIILFHLLFLLMVS